MHTHSTAAALLVSAGLASCASHRSSSTADDSERVSVAAAKPAAANDPTQNEIALEASAGWTATLALDQTSANGVWTVGVLDVFPQFGCPEIAALDDKGRFHALWSYSGKWTPSTTVNDGKWLGGLAQADVDPRVPGTEIYVGSQNGNVWQITTHLETFLDCRLVAQLPGCEVHTLVAGELDPRGAGAELLVFTRPGALYELRPRADRDGFDAQLVEKLDGRIRDALVLSDAKGAQRVATVGRHGRFELLNFDATGAHWKTVYETPMGLGRLALKPRGADEALVVYTVADDGRVFRHEERGADSWTSELIYAGPQGMRGCAAGHFDADPKVETLAVFGYSQRVELLSRKNGAWRVETLFTDRDKGHWICAGELDGRNSTDELVSSGYSGRVVVLARPPGFGLSGVLTAK